MLDARTERKKEETRAGIPGMLSHLKHITMNRTGNAQAAWKGAN